MKGRHAIVHKWQVFTNAKLQIRSFVAFGICNLWTFVDLSICGQCRLEVRRRDGAGEREGVVERAEDREVAAEGNVRPRIVAEDRIVPFAEGVDPDDGRRGVGTERRGALEVRDHLVGDFVGRFAPGAVDAELHVGEGAEGAVGRELAERAVEVQVVRRAVPAVEPRVVAEPLVGRVVAQHEARVRERRVLRERAGEGEPFVARERGPGGVGRRDDAEAVAVVERAVGRGVVREVHPDGEVGPAAVDGQVGAFAAERLPEGEDRVAHGAVALGEEAFAVEELPRAAGGVGAAAEAEGVGEPDGVGADGVEERARLAPEELAERRPLRDAVRVARIARGVGVEAADGVDAAHGREARAQEDLRVALVAERRLGEFAAGVEREDEREGLAEDVRAGAARGGDDALHVGVV